MLRSVDSSGQCCGLDDTVVNGSCCPNTQVAGSTCCAAGTQVCGSACCGGGQVCLNAVTSQCGAPTGPLLEFWNTSANTGTVGDQTCGTTPCKDFTWGSAITLRGVNFLPDNRVTITVGNPVQTFVATTDLNGAFTTTIAPTGLGPIVEPITAEQLEGTFEASVTVSFNNPAQ
jgi:hypothetical protein